MDRSIRNGAQECPKGREKIGRKPNANVVGYGRPVRVELSIIPLSTVIPLSHGYERLVQRGFAARRELSP